MVSNTIEFLPIPLFFLGFSAVAVFLLSRFLKISNKLMAAITAVSFLAVIFYLFNEKNIISQVNGLLKGLSDFFGTFKTENFYYYEPGAFLITVITLILSFLVSIYCGEYLKLDRRQHAFYPLLILMVTGLTGMLFSANLMGLYLFCELMSISAYALVAFRHRTDTAVEAGFKYLVMGSAASILILMGIGFLFVVSGSINIFDISPSDDIQATLAALFIFAGFGLKSALVPLHTWLPDAHGRAPSSISAILSGILVQGALYVLVKIILTTGFDSQILGTLLMVMGLLNIGVGNLMGLVQTHTKRLLGYSTIAQMGYITVCMAVGVRNNSQLALQAAIFILIAHSAAKSLAFLTKGIFHYYVGASEISHLSRASDFSFFPTLAFSTAIISLSAIPPLPGFTGKWSALTSFFSVEDPATLVITLVFLLGSLTAFGYYFRLLINLYSKTKSVPNGNQDYIQREKVSAWMGLPTALLMIAILFITAAPQNIMNSTVYIAEFLIGLMR